MLLFLSLLPNSHSPWHRWDRWPRTKTLQFCSIKNLGILDNSVFLYLFVSSLWIIFFFFCTFLACFNDFSYNLHMAGGSPNESQMQKSIWSYCITVEKSPYDLHRDRVTSRLLHHCTVFIYFSQLLELSCTSCRWKPHLFYALEWMMLFFTNTFQMNSPYVPPSFHLLVQAKDF